jgi:hypothetical protein
VHGKGFFCVRPGTFRKVSRVEAASWQGGEDPEQVVLKELELVQTRIYEDN